MAKSCWPWLPSCGEIGSSNACPGCHDTDLCYMGTCKQLLALCHVDQRNGSTSRPGTRVWRYAIIAPCWARTWYNVPIRFPMEPAGLWRTFGTMQRKLERKVSCRSSNPVPQLCPNALKPSHLDPWPLRCPAQPPELPPIVCTLVFDACAELGMRGLDMWQHHPGVDGRRALEG